MTTIRFKETDAFQKDCKRLSKKFHSFENDLGIFRQATNISPTTGKHVVMLTEQDEWKIIKKRMTCRSLRSSSLRMIYAYNEKKSEITLIQLYFKGNKETEDKKRILDFISALEPLHTLEPETSSIPSPKRLITPRLRSG